MTMQPAALFSSSCTAACDAAAPQPVASELPVVCAPRARCSPVLCAPRRERAPRALCYPVLCATRALCYPCSRALDSLRRRVELTPCSSYVLERRLQQQWVRASMPRASNRLQRRKRGDESYAASGQQGARNREFLLVYVPL
eukprot:COSAG06_NODE_842_length_11986_cov_54.409355_10_plen_142_part_00